MVRFFLHKTCLVRFLALAYLLIGMGFGNAVIWCQESEAFSHLEYNLAGQCQSFCFPVGKTDKTDGQRVGLDGVQPLAANCLDTQASHSLAPAPEAKSTLAPPVPTASSTLHVASLGPLATANLTHLNLLAQPPPPQALTALRTIVLLI